MARYEYKVVPAPHRGEKARGVKTPEARFALAVETLMNRMAEDGWEYLRAETLPSEERAGLTSTTTQWRNLLVFRRRLAEEAEAAEEEGPRLLEAPPELRFEHRPPPDDGFPPMPPLSRAVAARPATESAEDGPPSTAADGPAFPGSAGEEVEIPRILAPRPEPEDGTGAEDEEDNAAPAAGPRSSAPPRG